jgi:hypothetical protein
MRLHQWNGAEIEEHLGGDAAILRGTYFGELVLTPNALAELHARAIAPIRRRWQPEVHQMIDAERHLRRMLGETQSWDDLQELADRLETDAASVETDLDGLVAPLAVMTAEIPRFARDAAAALTRAYAGLVRGDLEFLRQQLANPPCPAAPELSALPRRLRSSRQRAALSVTNALADAQSTRRLLEVINSALSKRLVVVLADAGCGKTEIAGQLTAAVGNRPVGILLHGRELSAGDNLDDFARQVVIQGTPVPSMEALIAAADAAGQRARQRLPIVIDGLNEAEDPRNWKHALASLDETLRQYPYVLLVCTVRTAFADEVLPPDVHRLEIPDFGGDTEEAIRRYFANYRIDAADADFPWEYLKTPLTLRLFCEVTNPTRASVAGVERIPRSLTALFDCYLGQAAARIAELAPRTRRYYEADIRAAIAEIGGALWDQKASSLDLMAIRRQLGDEHRPWNESLIRALEEDGVLLRYPGEHRAGSHVAIVYDSLAGHVVADALLDRYGREKLKEWLEFPATKTLLAEATPEQHPLGGDILRALAGLVPRRLHGHQLWPLLTEPLQTEALCQAALLESAYLDGKTVDALATLTAQPQTTRHDLFNRLFSTRGVPNHPLNAEFLDRVLRSMMVGERDLRWSEWIRSNSERFLGNVDLSDDLDWLQERWRNTTERSLADRLRARWVTWLLTTTVRPLRDHATRSLYWFGRGDPAALFELTLDSLAINDPYVAERLLAASFGVVMAHQLPDPEFADVLKSYLIGLREALTGQTASSPTNHWLARLYVQGTVNFARTYDSAAVSDGLETAGCVKFAAGPQIRPIAKDDPGVGDIGHTLHMDFENYTIGRLFRQRRIYDMSHTGYQAAIAHVHGMVWALGWRESLFAAADRYIAGGPRHEDGRKTDRYGKKYGWIGFYTYAGIFADNRQLTSDQERLSEVDIDPSFPVPPPLVPIDLQTWARPTPKDDRRWIGHGIVSVPDELLYSTEFGPHRGPWIAVYGEINSKDQRLGREVFGCLTALLVEDTDVERLIENLNTQIHPGGWWLPDAPRDHYTFAGEIPWSPAFARPEDAENPAHSYCKPVDMSDGSQIEVEILTHRYSWESYHSLFNVGTISFLLFRVRFAGTTAIVRPARARWSEGGVVIPRPLRIRWSSPVFAREFGP